MITIDGSMGEGGGQVLRSSLALSLLTSIPLRISNIRAGRTRPGLMRQHLVAVQASASISGAEVSGAELGSTELLFRPGSIRDGDYHFAIGSAGSTTLVFQTIVLPLMLGATRPSTLSFEGGTHNPMAPPFDFIERVFLPLLERMGARVEVALARHGFYPAGGGEWSAIVHPWNDCGGSTCSSEAAFGRRARGRFARPFPARSACARSKRCPPRSVGTSYWATNGRAFMSRRHSR